MKRLTLLLLVLISVGALRAQISLNTFGAPVVRDFTGYTGAGFTPGPAAGELDSDEWSVDGFDAGVLAFGGVQNTPGTDFARGLTTAGTPSTGGLYALDNGGNAALWIQATAADFTPGTITVRCQNNTGGVLNTVDVAYDALSFNNGGFRMAIDFAYGTDSVNFSTIAAANYMTVAPPVAAALDIASRTATLTGLNVPNGGFFYLRWAVSEIPGGTGSRDEIGLDNITITASNQVFGNITFNNATAVLPENAGNVSVGISVAPGTNCTVDVALVGGTATAGSDFTFTSPQTVTLSVANPTVTFTFPLIDDVTVEAVETAIFTLTNPSAGCLVGANNLFTVTIVDNDLQAVTGIVITEIMYNSPESGTDSLEFIELYNNTASAINLASCNFGNALTYTFPAGAIIGAGQYLVVANNAIAFNNVYGFQPFEDWGGGSLNNNGAILTFFDAFGNTVDNVPYDDAAPWPTTPDGLGASLTLCDPNADNALGANWAAAQTPTGDVINAYPLLATPGADDPLLCGGGTPPVVGFFTLNGTVSETAGTLALSVSLTNPDNDTTRVTVALDAAGSTAVNGQDFTFTPTTLTFLPNVGGQQNFIVTPIDDILVETNETMVFVLTNLTNNGIYDRDTLIITLTSDDIANTPTVSFVGSNVTVDENVGTVSIDVTLANPNNNPTSVDVTLVGGDATLGQDFTYGNTTVTFPANTTGPQTVTLPIVDDALSEFAETIVLQLGNPTNNALLQNDTYTVTINASDFSGAQGMVITEIFYDMPGAGNDSLEFVEILNNTASPIDLNGSEFTLGFSHQFTTTTIVPPGGYLVLARFAAYFNSVFGFTPIQWNSGALTNVGEPIVMLDAQGNLVDTVFFRPGGAWPTGTAGTGSSIVLCDANTDNNIGGNWRAAIGGTGVFINGSEIKATPGSADNLTCAPAPAYDFASATYSYNEGAGQISVGIQLSVPYPAITQCSVVLVTGGTATNGADFNYTSPQIAVFPANNNNTVFINFPVIDDADVEGNETFILVLQDPSAPAILGALDTVVVTIEDNEAPLDPLVNFAVANATANEADGTISVTVNIVAPNANATSVDVSLVGGTAVAGQDFTFAAQTLTFPGGSNAPQTATLSLTDDAISELPETIVLRLSNPTNNATVNIDTFTLTVIDNDVTPSLILVGVYDAPLAGGQPKGVELYATAFIPDLSIYGLSSCTNGGGIPATPEWTFPAVSANAGECIFVSNDSVQFTAFFGFPATFSTNNNAVGINGDDASVLYFNGTVLDVFGDPNVDGTGTIWDFLDGWAYRFSGTGPSATFDSTQWTYSGINVFDGQTTNATTPIFYPNCTFTATIIPNLGFVSNTASVPENLFGGQYLVDVTLTNPANTATEVDVILDVLSTASVGADFVFQPLTLTFPAGTTTTLQVPVDLLDDALNELPETVVLRLVNATNAANVTIGTFTLTILDNDTPPVGGLVLTEINYNDPTGPDSLEFVEIYNNSGSTISLDGVNFSAGITYTFPAGTTLAANEYIVVARFPAYLQAVTGFAGTALQWAPSSLNNAGEAVVLRDQNGNLIDSVTYSDVAPWYPAADGTGPSLVLCDPNSDNTQAANWRVSTTPAGSVNTPTGLVNLFVSPGADDNACVIGLDEAAVLSATVFPNPTEGLLFFSFSAVEEIKVEVVNLSGQIVRTALFFDATAQMELQNLPKGMYFVRLTETETGHTAVHKIVLH